MGNLREDSVIQIVIKRRSMKGRIIRAPILWLSYYKIMRRNESVVFSARAAFIFTSLLFRNYGDKS